MVFYGFSMVFVVFSKAPAVFQGFSSGFIGCFSVFLLVFAEVRNGRRAS